VGPDLWTVLARDQARAGSGSGSRTIGPRAGGGRGEAGLKKAHLDYGGQHCASVRAQKPSR
jgi:hypothetical protein